ncbi:uncharacterized protein [Populus alba]|uniref:uncharacterized protein isoform X1 n=1 Tax=Populus alba TaxID=43335 RepID=UPI00158B8434|nr:uncharacterized protein LOC118037035 isoform X1 [Populus alba]
MVSAVVFYPQNTFFNKPSCVSFSKQLKLGYPIYSLKDGSLAFASQNGVLQSSDRKLPLSSNQEEIMALFRRIQYSISQGESTATGKKNAGRSEKSPTDSILEVLLRSRKRAKDTNTVTEGKNVPTHKQSVPQGPEDASTKCLSGF